ncbi:MAG: UvrD-helicase domain-containing protein, partial [Deltaproteobacteria bacterium]|nr:UvrD-helicase domain-containing protein [Deltaproteobacteria bacterium]
KRMKELALKQIDEILAGYDEWQVRTIDSFIYRLIQAAPQELGLSQQDEIEAHEAPLRAAALDRVLLCSAKDPGLWELLQDLVRHYLLFQARGSWWPRAELLRVLESLNEKETTYGLRFEIGKRRKGSRDLAMELSKSTQGFLDKAETHGLKLKSYSHKALSGAACGDLPKALSSKAWEREELKDLCLKGASVSKGPSVEWKALRNLAGAYAEARALEVSGPYLKMLVPWRDQLSDLKSGSRSIFFSDINSLARRLLNEFALPEVIFRLGDRLYHFLLDEFQDTSILQWEALFPLIDNAMSQGGSLFCVGDRKQLLYRWRGSDLEVFQNGPGSFASLGETGPLDFVLPYNWRSREVLLRFVAQVFDRGNLERWIKEEPAVSEVLDPEYIGNVFSGAAQELPPAHAISHKGGTVRVEILSQEGRLEEVKEKSKLSLVKLLKEDVLFRHSPRDVMVLVRDNQDVKDFSHSLISAGIPVFSHRQLDIREDPLVQEILEILRFLERPVDDQALASVIVGNILKVVWEEEAAGLSPWEWLEGQRLKAEGRRAKYLYQRLQKDFPGLWAKTLGDAFVSVGFLPPYDLVSMLIRRMDLIRCFPNHFVALSHLLELLYANEPEYGGDLRGFIQWMETGPDEIFGVKTPQEIDAVRIMTIHKAKGLEAKVVILPLATLGMRADGRIYSMDGGDLKVWHTSQELRNVSQGLLELYKEDCGKAWLDELNVLYVSLTRARDELYVFVPQKAGGRQKNRLIFLLEPLLNGNLVAKWGDTIQNKIPESKKSDLNGQPIDREPYEKVLKNRGKKVDKGWNWPKYLVRRPKELKVLLSPTRKSAIGFGDFVHRLLARLDGPLDCQCSHEEVQALLQEILLSIPESPDAETGKEVDLGTIARTICHPMAMPLFWIGSEDQIWVEKEVADKSGEIFRPDRLVKGQNTLWVGEYKTGSRARAEDKRQVSQYLDLLSQLYPDHETRGVILYLDKEVAERI